MVELATTTQVNPVEQQDKWRIPRVVAALSVVGSLAIAGCSGGSKESHKAQPTDVTSPNTSNDICNSLELDRNLANVNYGVPEALLPALNDVKNGKEVLTTPDVASQRIQTNVQGDVWALAQMSAVFELRESRQPLKGIVNRIHDKVVQFSRDPQAAKNASEQVCAALDAKFLKPTDSFAFTTGVGTELEATRVPKGAKNQGDVIGLRGKNLASAGSFTGFEWDYNHDDQSLTKEQRDHMDSVVKNILIDENGTIIINNLTGEAGFVLNPQEQKNIPAGGKPNQQNNGGNRNGTNQGNQGTGGAAGPNGNNPEAGPGGSTPSPGGPGGTTPETTTPGTTPNTTPNTTTPRTTPPTTSPPPPPTTTPRTTPPTTTPSPPSTKGTVPCDPNIQNC